MSGALKRVWDEYFNIPPDGYISDRVFLTRMTVGVLFIVLCMICIGWSAWVLFDSGTKILSGVEGRV